MHGYKAVELDNLDSWTRSGGSLSSASNMAFARLLIARAHASRLAVAQKNTAELATQGRRLGFDFAVAEECQVYGECDSYTAAYGRHVIEIEYTDDGLADSVSSGGRLDRALRVVEGLPRTTPAGGGTPVAPPGRRRPPFRAAYSLRLMPPCGQPPCPFLTDPPPPGRRPHSAPAR